MNVTQSMHRASDCIQMMRSIPPDPFLCPLSIKIRLNVVHDESKRIEEIMLEYT